MNEIGKEFLSYLIDELKFSKEDCIKAWEKAQKHFPSYNPEITSHLLTLEVVTRDILRGDFRPDLAEVKKII